MHHVFRVAEHIQSDMGRFLFTRKLKKSVPNQTSMRPFSRRFALRSNERKLVQARGINYISVHARLGGGLSDVGGRFDTLMRNLNISARCLASRSVLISLMIGHPTPLSIFLATDTPILDMRLLMH